MTESAGVTRARAAQVVTQVRSHGHALTPALLAAHTAALADRDRAFVHELVYGTLRTLPRLELLMRPLLQRPFKAKDQDVAAVLLVGLYQLDQLQLPAHAAVGETVAAVRVLDKPWAAGVINATLRRWQRTGSAALLATLPELDQTSAQWHLPAWLLAQVQQAWPADWQQIAAASHSHPPLFLRVNALHTTRAAYLDELTAAGLTATALPESDAGLRLATPVATSQLPGYAAGAVSVQDAGAQLVAALLDAQPGQRVLDACAAPGGKTAHLQERAGNQLQLTALEYDPVRYETLRQQLARVGVTAECICADATQTAGAAWAAQQYDRILLDVPCSGTGVMRRHPDSKCLRRASDIATFAAQQAQLLDALWPLLAPNGQLLYVTCSVLPAENTAQIAAFLMRQPNAVAVPIETNWGIATAHGRQLLPTVTGSDGFFFALLQSRQP